MKSVNKNFLLNVAYQLLTYVFPLITVPYVSRVLGVENVGIYSYTYSIAYIFMLVGMLGINNYGNRAIAKCRDSKEELSKTFLSIYGLQLVISTITLICYVAYVALICDQYKLIAMLHILNLLSVCCDINWFYFGLEKFKLTITRNLVIKIFSVFLIFLLVKSSSDLWKYTIIMAGATLIGQVYLFVRLPRYITKVKLHIKQIFAHFRGVLKLFIPVLAFGVYRVMDKTMIGAISTVTELGYYENAERIINIPVAIINALGTVMLPRMSYILKDGKADFKKPIYESMKLAMLLAVAMALGLMLIADEVAIVIFGNEFARSGGIIRLLAVTVIASAWANVIRTQYLIPKGLDNIYIYSTLGGAVVNLICNLLFIRLWGAYGACIGTIVAEFFVVIYQSIKVRKELDISKYLKVLLIEFAKSSVVMFGAGMVGNTVETTYFRLIVKIVVAIVLFLILNYKYIINEFIE